MDAYQRPAPGQVFSDSLEIKRSKFVTFVTQAESEATAREFIAQVKHQHPQARHHCSAFIIHQPGRTPLERSNDDGEPSGTAGTPMLDVLRGSGYLDVVAVVVRYFGGVKLGAGGLVHAYSEAVSRALMGVSTTWRGEMTLFRTSFTHAYAGRYEAELRAHGFLIVDKSYEARVHLTLAVRIGQEDHLRAVVASMSSGGAALEETGTTWVEYPHDEQPY